MTREELYTRLADILRRHVRYPEDCERSDLSLVCNVYARFIASREDYIIDPNE